MINQQDEKQKTIELTESEAEALVMMIMQFTQMCIIGMQLPKNTRFLPEDCPESYLDAMEKISKFLITKEN